MTPSAAVGETKRATESNTRDMGAPNACDWVMVPKEPTREMFEAGRSALRSNSTRQANARVAYMAMLSAAPSLPVCEKRLLRVLSDLRELHDEYVVRADFGTVFQQCSDLITAALRGKSP